MPILIFRHWLPVLTLQHVCSLILLSENTAVSQMWDRCVPHFCLQCCSSDIEREIYWSDDFLYARFSLFSPQWIRTSEEDQEAAWSRHSSDVSSPTPKSEDTNTKSICQCYKHRQRTNSAFSLDSNLSRRKSNQYENQRPR